MRPDVLVGPAPWVIGKVGTTLAGELWTRIPEALRTAIARAVNAHPHARPTIDRLFANPHWMLPYEELVLGLGKLDGAAVVSSPRSGYQLVVLRGQVIVPWCYGASGAISMREAGPGRPFSRLARELMRRFGPAPRNGLPQLPLVRDEIDEREVAHICGEVAKVTLRPNVLIAGYAATADHGLLRACLGQAGGPSGWTHVDDLPLPPPVIPRPRRMQFP